MTAGPIRRCCAMLAGMLPMIVVPRCRVRHDRWDDTFAECDLGRFETELEKDGLFPT